MKRPNQARWYREKIALASSLTWTYKGGFLLKLKKSFSSFKI